MQTNNAQHLLNYFSTLDSKTKGYHWINKSYVATYNNELISSIHYGNHYTLLIATNHEDDDDTYTSDSLDGFDGKLDVFKLTDPYGESTGLAFGNTTTNVAFTNEVHAEFE